MEQFLLFPDTRTRLDHSIALSDGVPIGARSWELSCKGLDLLSTFGTMRLIALRTTWSLTASDHARFVVMCMAARWANLSQCHCVFGLGFVLVMSCLPMIKALQRFN